MILPLEHLIKYQQNMYALSCAAMKRVVQIAATMDELGKKRPSKLVSTALKDVLSNQVQYRLED